MNEVATDEDRARRVNSQVATCRVGGAESAVGERGAIGLALDQLLALQ